MLRPFLFVIQVGSCVFAYYSNSLLFDDNINLLFRVAVSKNFVSSFMLFVAVSSHDGSGIDRDYSPRVQHLCRRGIILLFSQGVLYFLQDVGFFGVVCGYTSDTFRHTWYSVLLYTLTGKVTVMSVCSRILQATALFPIFCLDKS